MSWSFFKRKRPVAKLPNTGITINTWLAAELWKEVAAEFKKPIFQHVLTLVIQQRPRGFPMRGQQVSDIQAAIELGRIEGYNNCLDFILSLANPPTQKPEPIESDYGSDT